MVITKLTTPSETVLIIKIFLDHNDNIKKHIMHLATGALHYHFPIIYRRHDELIMVQRTLTRYREMTKNEYIHKIQFNITRILLKVESIWKILDFQALSYTNLKKKRIIYSVYSIYILCVCVCVNIIFIYTFFILNVSTI